MSILNLRSVFGILHESTEPVEETDFVSSDVSEVPFSEQIERTLVDFTE